MPTKKPGVIATILILLAAVMIAGSYTIAEIKSPVKARLTRSEDALIAVKDNYTFTVTAGQPVREEISITNNMDVPVTVKAWFDNPGGGIGISGTHEIFIKQGETKGLEIEVWAEEGSGEQSANTGVTYVAKWNGGSAFINGRITVNVLFPEDDKTDSEGEEMPYEYTETDSEDAQVSGEGGEEDEQASDEGGEEDNSLSNPDTGGGNAIE